MGHLVTARLRWQPDAIAIGVLAIAGALAFLPHLAGFGVFVGDSDRMNHSLTAFNAMLRGLRAGELPLWNEAALGGYSIAALAYYSPNPAVYLAHWLGVQDVYRFAGYEAAVLFFLSGLSAYGFLRASGRTPLGAGVGGMLYQTSALAVLRVSQLDLTHVVLVAIPILLLLVRRLAERPGAANYLLLFLLSAFVLGFTFLQEAAYAGLLTALYAGWLSWGRRSWAPTKLAAAAALPAVLLALPRLFTIGQDFSGSNRVGGGFKWMSELYDGNGFRRYEVLRWFDERIFGATFEEVQRLGNSINLHEGFLLYLTAYAPFLLAGALALRLPWKQGDRDAQFSAWALLFALFVVFTPLGYWILWMAFMRVDFLHLRVLIIALLPACALVALALECIRNPAGVPAADTRRYAWIAAAAALGIEAAALCLNAAGLHLPVILGRYFQGGSVLRITASMALLWLGWRLYRRAPAQRDALRAALAVLVVLQAAAYAVVSVWGPGRWPEPQHLYQTPTRIMAPPGYYRVPSDTALSDVRARLEADRYRTTFICPPNEIGIFCPTQLANFWRLRSIDGYVSTIPGRLAALPLHNAVSLRVVSFTSLGQLDWPLLGLYNVKYALRYRPELLANAVRVGDERVREIESGDLDVVENPAPVAPRAFFVRSVVSVPSLEVAVQTLFPAKQGKAQGYHPQRESVVEDIDDHRLYPTEGHIDARYEPDRVTLTFPPLARDRFLVLNERYDRRWVARDDEGRVLHIHPTNVLMRGVVVPAGTSGVQFAYEPFSVSPRAGHFYAAGLLAALLLCIVIAATRRWPGSFFHRP